jgi:hypothetical protein
MIINKVQVYKYFIDIVRMDNLNRSTAGVIDVLTISNDIKILPESLIVYELNMNLTRNISDYYENI